MQTLLLTGFDIWGKKIYNSSWEILAEGVPLSVPGWQIRTLQLPVSWRRAPQMLEVALSPEVKGVVCFGMSGADRVHVERVAINLASSTVWDVDKEFAPADLVCPDGPPAYWTGLPYADIVAALNQAGILCEESQCAGNYLCNTVFYWLMHNIATQRPDLVGGFVHVPAFSLTNNMTKEQLQKAVQIISQVLLAQ
jgi:pyroglutamyl-peptidase